ncbi:Lanosterol 14-alpha-demethylase [Blastocladiella emersonii ATCC 22665]|nr:Lanosterol 14-alpha-demethylase [Blastocladiella emersonii ATCC 22665]
MALESRIAELAATTFAKFPQPVQDLAAEYGLSPVAALAAAAAVPLAVAGTVHHVRRRNRRARRAQGKAPPHVRHLVPFFGSMVAFGMDPIKFLQTQRAQLGDLFTMTMFGREMTFALGPDGNHLVLNAKVTVASAKDAYNSMTKPIFGEDVAYDADPAVFVEQKKFIKMGLHTENLRAFVGMIEKETRGYFARWSKAEGTEELFTAMSELTIMTASRCLFGSEVRERLDEGVAALYHDLDQGFQPINFLFEWLPLPSYRRRDIAHVKMRNVFLGIIEARRKEGRADRQDVLQALMDATYKNGVKFTDREAAHMMIGMLMAGQHTSSTTTTWALAHLADAPEVYAALVAELQRELGADFSGTLDFDVLKRCELLDAVLRETLRIHPPITSIMRKVVQPIEYKGYVIPAGHYIAAAPVVSALQDDMYENPTQWLPSRWLASSTGKDGARIQSALQAEAAGGDDYGFGVVGGSARSHYLPFGAGRHRCIGEPFAYVQIKTILATTIREFASLAFKNGAKFPGTDHTSMIVMPVRPVMVSYERRIPPANVGAAAGPAAAGPATAAESY